MPTPGHPDSHTGHRPGPSRGPGAPEQDSTKSTAHTCGTEVHYPRHMAWIALHLQPHSRWVGMTSPRRCAACFTPLPAGAPARKRFCDTTCQRRAQSRRRRGLPEQDPTVAAVDSASLTKADRQLAGKQRTITRLREGRQADRDRARAAGVKAAAADRRAERAIESMGRDLHTVNRQKAELAETLRQARWDLEKERKRAERMRQVLSKYQAAADADHQVPAETIRRQWEALAARIARQASGPSALPLAGLDQEVVSTWQKLRQQAAAPPAGTKAPQQPARRTRPTTSPRRRNR